MKKFTDAQEMAALYPDTFAAPEKDDLDKIKPGDSVKVCSGRERFWVSVISIDGDKINGIIDNNLISIDEHGLSHKDVVCFEKRHVYQIY
jgi:hypothetical protein